MNLTRSLLTIILPGMVALGPWLLLAMMQFPDIHVWYKEFTAPFHVAAFGLAIIAGCTFEEIGNYLERRWDVALACGPKPELEDSWVVKDWYAYLTKGADGCEPVAHRYLSRKVTALYFELGMMSAAPIALAAIAFLVGKLISNHPALAYGVGFLSAFVAVAFFISAKHTHALLCEVRHFLANPS